MSDDGSNHNEHYSGQSEWDIEVGSDLSRASTAPRPSSRPTSRIPDGAGGMQWAPLSRSNTIRMTTDAFEKLYLSPQNRVSGSLRSTFGVPTPLALIGFLIAGGPLSIALMGWRGAGGAGIGTLGATYYFGGMLQLVGAMLEWIVGNTLPFVLFGTFGAFFLAYGMTQDPNYNIKGSYIANATTPEEKAAGLAEFEATVGFFFMFLAVLVFIFLICSLRTNVVFLANMFLIQVAVCLLLGSQWVLAEGKVALAERLGVACGACVFATTVLGFYLLAAQLLEITAFPLTLPVGDLSTRFGRTKRVPMMSEPKLYEA